MPQPSLPSNQPNKKKMDRRQKLIVWAIIAFVILIPLVILVSPHSYTLNNDTSQEVTVTACATALQTCANPIAARDGRAQVVLQPGESASWTFSVWQPLWFLIHNQSGTLIGCPQSVAGYRAETWMTSRTRSISSEITNCPFINGSR